MTIAAWFGIQIVFWAFYILFAQEVGILNDAFGGLSTPPEPSGGSFLDQVLAPFAYAWSWAQALFKFVTFEAAGIPAIFGATVFLGLQGINGVLIWRLIRAG